MKILKCRQDVDFVPILMALYSQFEIWHLLSGGGIGTPTFLSPLELALVGNPILEAGCIKLKQKFDLQNSQVGS